jgi:hypothetical protein
MPFCEEHGVIYGEGCFCVECEVDVTEQAQQAIDEIGDSQAFGGFLDGRPRKVSKGKGA